MENKSQLARLLFIDREIRQGMQKGRLANCASLAREYEVSAKTILRDIDYLRVNWNAPIEYDPSRKGYFYSEENYALPAINIRESDLFSLLVAQKGLEQYRDTPVHDSLASIFAKIEKSLPENVSINTAWLDSRISILPEQHTTIKPAVWDTLAKAMQQNKVVRITYQKPGGRAAGRRVNPYHLAKYQGEWYLIGHCHRRDKVLTFAVSRIAEAERLAASFEVPSRFDYENSLKNNFGIIRGDGNYTVRLRFSREEARYVLERAWHPKQRVQRHRNGDATLSVPATDLFEIKRWVLSRGPGVKVLAPPELVRAVKKDLRNSLKAYERENGREKRRGTS